MKRFLVGDKHNVPAAKPAKPEQGFSFERTTPALFSPDTAECFADIDGHQPLGVRHDAIRRLLDHIQLAPVDFDLIERLWLAARDLIQREQPKEVQVYFSPKKKNITFSHTFR